MSMRPATLKTGPATTNALIKKRYVLIYVLMIWLDSLFPLFLIWDYSSHLNPNNIGIDLMFTIAFHGIGWYFAWVLSAIFISKAFLIVVNLIHKPREGYFPRDGKNKDVKYWCIRAVIKKYSLYIVHHFPLPWIDIIAFKMFGVKTPTKVSLFDAWVDTEFIEIGENTIIGQGSLVMSSMVTKDYLIIQKIKIGKNCVIGGYSVLSPGSIVGDNVTLGTHSATTIGQELESDWVYLGVPARQYKKNEYKSMEESDEEIKRTSKKYIKQYLTIDDLEEVDVKKTVTKKGELRLLKEKEQDLLTLLEGETDDVQIRRTERALSKIRERIRIAEERKTVTEKLHIKTTNLEKLEKKESKLREKLAGETDVTVKQRDLERLKKLKQRIESEKIRQDKILKEGGTLEVSEDDIDDDDDE